MERALVITVSRSGASYSGDQIVLRHVLARLEHRYECEVLTVEGAGRVAKVANIILNQVPSEWSAYYSDRWFEAVRALTSRRSYARVFILYEALFYLAEAVSPGAAKVVLYSHNVPSQYSSGENPLETALHRLAVKAEMRWYAPINGEVVYISRSDRDAAVEAQLATPEARVAPPGAPPAKPLADDATFIGEAVITGSYDWWRKRRDLKAFATGCGDVVVHGFDPWVKEVLPSSRFYASADALDWTSHMRLGVVTDRFPGGFKLKTLEYVARNCAVFSSAPVMSDFTDLPYADRFVFDNQRPEQLADVCRALAARDPEVMRREFLAFKEACCAYYDWDRCLEPLLSA
jgi:hypothetical protein